MAKRGVTSKDVLVKLIVGAGQASPSPPVGPALGSKGVKSMDFCKEFNARTAHYLPGTPIPALVTVRPDRSFTFTIRTPPTATLLLTAAGVTPVKNRLRGAGNTAGPSKLRSLIAARVAVVASKDASLARAGTSAQKCASRAAEGQEEEGEEDEGEEEGSGGSDEAEEQSAQHVYAVQAAGKASGKELNGNSKVGVIGTVSVKHVFEIAKIKAQEDRLAALGLEKIARSVVAQAGSMGVAVVP